MASKGPAGDTVTVRLQEAIDRLQEDVRRVEVWAGALSGFLQPVPDYEAEEQKHMLPPRERRSHSGVKTTHAAHSKPPLSTPLKRA